MAINGLAFLALLVQTHSVQMKMSPSDINSAPPAAPPQVPLLRTIQAPQSGLVVQGLAYSPVAQQALSTGTQGGIPVVTATAVVNAEAASSPPADPTVQNSASAASVAANAATTAIDAANTAAAAANQAAIAAANAAATAPDAANAAASAATTAIDAANAATNAAAQAAAAAAANRATNLPATANVAVLTGSASTPNLNLTANAVAPLSPSAAPVPSSLPWFIVAIMQLAAGVTFTMVIKTLCIVGNVAVQIAPLPQVRSWEVSRSTGEFDSAPYVAIAFGGCNWCFYGMFAFLVTSKSGFLVLVQSNCLGAILGTYYVSAFYRNCSNKASFAALQKYLSAVTTLVLLQVCSLSTLPAERALFITGLISSFCSFLGASSVLVTVPAVLSSRDSRSIPGPYVVANLAASVVWSLCGIILEDPLVMIPNMFSTLCSAASLSLKFIYPSDASAANDGNLAMAADFELEEGASNEISDIHFDKPSGKFSTGKYMRTEFKSLHTNFDKPSELSAIKPMPSQIDGSTFPNGFEYFKGKGQKLLAAAAPAGQKLLAEAGTAGQKLMAAWEGDGTGGTF